MTDGRKSKSIMILRCFGAVIVTAALAFVCSQHQHGGIKGGSIPLSTLKLIIIIAAMATAITRFGFKSGAAKVAAPFVGGIAGVFATGNAMCSPFGGIVGLLVGTVIAIIPLPHSGLLTRRST